MRRISKENLKGGPPRSPPPSCPSVLLSCLHPFSLAVMMFGTPPPQNPAEIQVMNTRGGYDVSAYEQPMPQTTPYGGVGFGLSGVGPTGPSMGMSMMGTPMGGGMGGMGGMGRMGGMGIGGMGMPGVAGMGGMCGGVGMGMGGRPMGGMGQRSEMGRMGMAQMGGMEQMGGMAQIGGMPGAMGGMPSGMGFVGFGFVSPHPPFFACRPKFSHSLMTSFCHSGKTRERLAYVVVLVSLSPFLMSFPCLSSYQNTLPKLTCCSCSSSSHRCVLHGPPPHSNFQRRPTSCRNNMMMFNPYQQFGGGAGGYGGMCGQGQYNPYMQMMGQHPMMVGAGMGGGMGGGGMGGGEMASGMMPQPGTGGGAGDAGSLQPFDSSKLKQGRMGHYGYLEGRGRVSPSSQPCEC